MPLFELSVTATQDLKDSVRSYHGLFQESKCEATALEELTVKAFRVDERTRNGVQWIPGTHSSDSDIVLTLNPNNIVGLSVKSGVMKTLIQRPAKRGKYRMVTEEQISLADRENGIIEVHGHRLTKHRGNFASIHQFLRDHVPTVMLTFVHSKEDRCYQIVYVDSSVFTYPHTKNDWTPMYDRTGTKVTYYVTTASNGLTLKIIPAKSWQIHWNFPARLCRFGEKLSF